ncbi:MAG: hypothetical protein GEU26_01910 [Nitrososphaeraceae archaeon]|nr:hypothetical protein [Nitrososphaeraceae archaeon]
MNSFSNCEQILTENAKIAKWTPNPIREALSISSVLWLIPTKIASGGRTRTRAIAVLTQSVFMRSSGEISLVFL